MATVKYWLRRWNQSNDLTDAKRSGRPRTTTSKQDTRIVSLAEQQTFATSRDLTDQMTKKGVKISERTVRRRLTEAGAKYNRPLSKPLLTEGHRKKRLNWARNHGTMDWDHVIFSDETTIRLNSVKGCLWNLPGRKKVIRTVKHSAKVNVWGCFSSRGFGRIICFKEKLNSKLMCNIYKRGLLPTARKQYGHGSTSWKLQEDNDPKHTSNMSANWKTRNGIQTMNWPSMSPDLAPIENVWQLLKMKLRRKNIFGFGNKEGMEVLTSGLGYQTCT